MSRSCAFVHVLSRKRVENGWSTDIMASGRACPVPDVPRQPFLPVASVVFAAFAPCLTVDFKLYGCDNL